MPWGGVPCRRPGGAGSVSAVRRRGVIAGAAVAVAAMCAGLLAPGGTGRAVSAAPRISWGRAEALRGSPAIGGINALSCWAVSNCAAGGETTDSAFVAVERNGRWGRTERLSRVEYRIPALVTAVSCAPGGYCVAGGNYWFKAHGEAFVATFKKGRWQKPLEVPDTAIRDHSAAVESVSCLAARRCVVAGDNEFGAFVAGQLNGTWQPAQTLLLGGGYTVLACWSPLDCVAAKNLTASELNGVWGTPQAIPGTYRDQVTEVSCARDGYCAAAGFNDSNGGVYGPPFVASGPDGSFGAAVTWPGLAPGPLSCPSAGNCVMAGGSQVVSQTDGLWGTPEQLPGTWTDVTISALSCWSAGNCAAGGSYVAVAGGRTEPFVASETNGRWSRPEPVPGSTALNKHDSDLNGVTRLSCPSRRHCTAAGTYSDAGDRQLGFVTGPA